MEREEATCAEPMGDSGEQGEAVPLLSVFFFFFFLAELGLSCGTWDVPFSLRHLESLVGTCPI